MAATPEQYANARLRVIRVAQRQFAAWVIAHPDATPDVAAEAVKAIIHQFAPVARIITAAWFNDSEADDDGTDGGLSD